MGNTASNTNATATTEAETVKTVKVKMTKTYIGQHGNYKAGKVYDLPESVYKVLEKDCEKVKG